MATDHETGGFYNTETAQRQTDASKVTRALSDNPVLPSPAFSY